MRPDAPRARTAGPDEGPPDPFPLRLTGKVVKGFGRGSSELGIPTANIPLTGLSVGGHEDIESGVYFGWAGLSPSQAIQDHPIPSGPAAAASRYNLISADVAATLYDAIATTSSTAATTASPSASTPGSVYPMVMSIGWNPFYKNTVRSVEVHIMQHFATDFYASHMNLAILGFIRPEYDYVSKESLIEDIRTDIDVAGRSLARSPYLAFYRDPELLAFKGRSEVGS